MNNKLISYEEAKERLKVLEQIQGKQKLQTKTVKDNYICTRAELVKELNKRIADRKQEINLLLSIIHAHKQARKYYGKLQSYLKEEQSLLNQFGD